MASRKTDAELAVIVNGQLLELTREEARELLRDLAGLLRVELAKTNGHVDNPKAYAE